MGGDDVLQASSDLAGRQPGLGLQLQAGPRQAAMAAPWPRPPQLPLQRSSSQDAQRLHLVTPCNAAFFGQMLRKGSASL